MVANEVFENYFFIHISVGSGGKDRKCGAYFKPNVAQVFLILIGKHL